MSKRLSSSQSNTLFNYFKSPQSAKTPNKLNSANDTNGTPKSSTDDSDCDKKLSKKHLRAIDKNVASDDDGEVTVKKRRVSALDDDVDSENETISTPKRFKKRRLVVCSSDSDEDEVKKPNLDSLDTNGSKAGYLSTFKFTNKTDDDNKEDSKSDINISSSTTYAFKEKVWKHMNYEFLKPGKIRDINKYPINHPDYDCKTLFVPQDFLNSLTPAMRQWWILKSKHYDSILFFKVGKFYELYHMDAVVAVNHLGLSYMKGDFAHSGFPEIAYGRMANSLIDQNFKVARVEQTETPEMMAERCKSLGKCGKFDKVVSREICQVSTKGTRIYGAQIKDAQQASLCYMLAIVENENTYGVCFVDTSIGTFHLGQFDDDKHCSKLLFLFSQHPPGLVLIERGKIKQETKTLIANTLKSVRCEKLTPNTQFYSAQKTVEILNKGCYFRDKNEQFSWPENFKQFIEDGCAKPNYELALKALGACVWYLKDSELDMQILCMKKFEAYEPVLNKNETTHQNYMVLDQNTVKNLNLLGSTGTLQKTLDYCKTSFGKRFLWDLICLPLCDVEKIMERQKAIQELYENNELRQGICGVLEKLPDLERQVTKIHIFGNKFCAQNHPDGRAVLYENKTYSKTKIRDLINTLKGFEKAQELPLLFSDSNSNLLNNLLKLPPHGQFIDLTDNLKFFETAFDRKQAETEGKIIPQKGVDDEYDEAEAAIDVIKKELDDYLKKQERFFGCTINYFGNDKKRFQLEIPENKTHKVNSEYIIEGSRKGSKPVKRYTTETTKKFLADMIKAENQLTKIVQDLNRRIFEKFSDKRNDWEQCIACLKFLDVFCAFAEYARSGSQNMCFPKVLPFQKEPTVNIEDAIHPCILLDDFVPNSTQLGTQNMAPLMLLTGPNMGGKSTLMRQVALIIIMAQMGCPVPAKSCQVSLVDRIFTRLGASDDILKGQSTFLVELSEASSILHHATNNSFVLLDELGRGTSTHDGNAIATAYVDKLININCRTIFSTHYHSLVDRYLGNTDIQLAHMACMADNEQDDSTSVTLLYKLSGGRCPKSYGFNAAKLAGLPEIIVKRAQEVAKKQEHICEMRKFVQNVALCDDVANLRLLLSNITF